MYQIFEATNAPRVIIFLTRLFYEFSDIWFLWRLNFICIEFYLRFQLNFCTGYFAWIIVSQKSIFCYRVYFMLNIDIWYILSRCCFCGEVIKLLPPFPEIDYFYGDIHIKNPSFTIFPFGFLVMECESIEGRSCTWLTANKWISN